MKRKIEIFTDGSGNSANTPGGWGFVVVSDGKKIYEACGHMDSATNNDAELEAALQGLRWFNEKISSNHINLNYLDILLVSDSQIILGWAQGITRVRQKAKEQRVNELQLLVIDMSVKCVWVKGHSGNEFNERCDVLANAGRQKLLPNEIKSRSEKSKIGTRTTGILCLEYSGSKFVVDLIRKRVERFDASLHGDRDTMYRLEDS